MPFLGVLPRHMEVSRLGVQSELWLPSYARTTATRDPSRLCDPHHSSRQRRIVNPLSKGRDRTRNSWFLVGFVNHCTTTGTPSHNFLIVEILLTFPLGLKCGRIFDKCISEHIFPLTSSSNMAWQDIAAVCSDHFWSSKPTVAVWAKSPTKVHVSPTEVYMWGPAANMWSPAAGQTLPLGAL